MQKQKSAIIREISGRKNQEMFPADVADWRRIDISENPRDQREKKINS